MGAGHSNTNVPIVANNTGLNTPPSNTDTPPSDPTSEILTVMKYAPLIKDGWNAIRKGKGKFVKFLEDKVIPRVPSFLSGGFGGSDSPESHSFGRRKARRSVKRRKARRSRRSRTSVKRRRSRN